VEKLDYSGAREIVFSQITQTFKGQAK